MFPRCGRIFTTTSNEMFADSFRFLHSIAYAFPARSLQTAGEEVVLFKEIGVGRWVDVPRKTEFRGGGYSPDGPMGEAVGRCSR